MTQQTWREAAARDERLDGLARLVLVSGKGGVGKSYVASHLARHFAARGERVILARIGGDQAGSAPNVPGATVLTIDPQAALRTQAGLILGSPRLARTVLDQRAIRGVLDLLPGVTEVALMLSLCQHLTDGQDRVVVDMPATGHGLGLLTAPRTLLGVVDGGRAHEFTARLQRRLEDPAFTSLVAVTTAEPFVLVETERLVASARALGVDPAMVVVNRLPSQMPAGARERAEQLAAAVTDRAQQRALAALAAALRRREHERAGLDAATRRFGGQSVVVGVELAANGAPHAAAA